MTWRIVFVCTGNICRSPTAEGVLRHLATARGMADRIEVASAGLEGWHAGAPPDARSQAHALHYGLRRLCPPQHAHKLKRAAVVVDIDCTGWSAHPCVGRAGEPAEWLVCARDADHRGKHRERGNEAERTHPHAAAPLQREAAECDIHEQQHELQRQPVVGEHR